MFGIDPITQRELVRFVTPIGIGAACYLAASLSARFVARTARQAYLARFIFLTLLLVLAVLFYQPFTATTFSGSPERWYELGGEARGMGSRYGLCGFFMWYVVALVAHPRRKHEKPN